MWFSLFWIAGVILIFKYVLGAGFYSGTSENLYNEVEREYGVKTHIVGVIERHSMDRLGQTDGTASFVSQPFPFIYDEGKWYGIFFERNDAIIKSVSIREGAAWGILVYSLIQLFFASKSSRRDREDDTD
jgi:hypothetical protein